MEDFLSSFSHIKTVIDNNKTADKVKIVGATKTRDISVIKKAVFAGLSIAGENRVQEFLTKYQQIDGLTWHFIGALQTNKVKYIVDKVEMIHSVDRLQLAEEIDRQCSKINKIMPILLEVNIGKEPSKSGVLPENLFSLIDSVKGLKNISIDGLMTVLPIQADLSMYRSMQELFEKVKSTYADLPIKYLSMGMSGDYETAVKYGANIVRIGSALFGERDYKR